MIDDNYDQLVFIKINKCVIEYYFVGTIETTVDIIIISKINHTTITGGDRGERPSLVKKHPSSES